MTQDAIIKVRNLTAKYGNNLILDNISFDVFRSEIFIILGGSGCGKSTLLRNIIGLEKTFSGQILINDYDVTSCEDITSSEFIKEIGILFQSSGLIGSMTLAENISLPIISHFKKLKQPVSTRFLNNIIKFKLQMVDLDGYGNHFPSEISGGMKKRAGLARAMALNPAILFLDEPSAGLDPVTSAEIDQLILSINKETSTTVVIVTHELESILTLGQRAIMLDKSTKGIIAQGNPFVLKTQSTNSFVKQFFNRQARS